MIYSPQASKAPDAGSLLRENCAVPALSLARAPHCVKLSFSFVWALVSLMLVRLVLVWTFGFGWFGSLDVGFVWVLVSVGSFGSFGFGWFVWFVWVLVSFGSVRLGVDFVVVEKFTMWRGWLVVLGARAAGPAAVGC
jgi:hypothetical protein